MPIIQARIGVNDPDALSTDGTIMGAKVMQVLDITRNGGHRLNRIYNRRYPSEQEIAKV